MSSWQARACGRLSDDERTAIRRNDIGFVYQFHHLLPEFSALENIMMPQLVRGLGVVGSARPGLPSFSTT